MSVLLPGGTAVVHFNTHTGGARTAADDTTALVFRNGTLTSIAPVITVSGVGHYIVTFNVPPNWVGYDRAWVEFSFLHMGEWNACSKDAGVVGAAGLDDNQEFSIDRILDLLEADETYDKASGKARKLLRGTNTVLLEKDVAGSTCVDSVEITE